MDGKQICTQELGCMTPARVEQCTNDSKTECWMTARTTATDGSEVTFTCSGGGGKKALFSRQRRCEETRVVSPTEVPSSLSWVQHRVI